MPAYIDFAEIKQRVSVLDAIRLLGLQMRQNGSQYRGACPACKSGGDRALAVNTDKASYFCFAQNKGGDVIAFAAHIRGGSQREAAVFLSGDAPEAKTTPSPTVKAEPDGRRDALQPIDYLETAHPVAEMLGLSAATLDAIGGGFKKKGTMPGRLLIPLRMADGTLVGYLGIATKAEQEPLLLFPKNLEERCLAAKPQQAVPETVEEEKLPVIPANELRKLFRVV